METSVVNKNKPEVTAGILFLLTGLSVIFTLLTDIKFLSAFTSLSDDLEYLIENRPWLQFNSFLLLTSAFLMSMLATSIISAFVRHQSFLGYLNGAFLLLSSAMFCIAGIKGLTANTILNNSVEAEMINPDMLKSNILILTLEKETYLTAAYILIGLGFFVTGIFTFITSKLPFLAGILSTITGIMIPVFNLFVPDKMLADTGLILACCLFFIFTIRFLFRGLHKNNRKRKNKRSKKQTVPGGVTNGQPS